MRKKLFLVWILALPAVLQAAASATPASPSGIAVEAVQPGATGDKAGLLAGDVLLSWEREPAAAALPASGTLALPFDLVEVFIEQVPRSRVTLHGRRDGEGMSWRLPQGASSAWQGVRAVPLLAGDALDHYQEGRARFKAGDFEGGAAALRSAAAAAITARSRGAEDLATWLLAEAARELARNERWGEADTLYSEALAGKAAPAATVPPAVAAQLFREWGELFQGRSSWDRAGECFERALAADRQKAFPSLAAALSLAGLGLIDNLSAGPKDDTAFFRQAMEIRQRLAPGSAEEALSWFQWGDAATTDRGWAKAVERYQHAVRILEKLETSRLQLADVLSSLARAYERQGKIADAEKPLLRADALVRQEAPDDFLMAAITQRLGLIAARKRDLPQAEELLARSLAVCRRSAPGSFYEADALHELGLVQIQAGKHEAGAQHLCQAVAGLETWRQRFQGNEEKRSRWGLFYAEFYQDCAESLVATGRSEEAFLSLEKGRARAFLDLRAERGFRLAALPPARGKEWQELNAEYDRTQEELDALIARKETALEQIVNLEGRLRTVRRKKERILQQELAPGSVRYPEPLPLAEARRRLEPGTVLLDYAVGKTKTLLFVLSPEGAPGWTVLTLEIGGAELSRKVESFRKTLIRDRFNQQARAAQAEALYNLLVRPADAYLERARRVVLAPDGPLNILPFAALRRDGRYLIEWKPLHFTLSATVYSDHLAHRSHPQALSAPKPAKLVAFGDALYPTAGAATDPPKQTRAVRQGLGPLPATREEVEGIAELFPGASVVLGEQVTEETVREAVRGASLVHFAVHGLLDERLPLNSALVLSPPGKVGQGKTNGLLQAWEVMESLPLDADLVTLSACDTALGREMRGEGLIGLTRAFQYAGARSVVATLWGISDQSTSGFMMQLYQALQAGQSKDEALRTAQLAQIHSAKPQPFYWAAFQLFGDWQ